MPIICLDATKFVLLSFFTLIETIFQKLCLKSRLKCAKSPLPGDARRSKTSLGSLSSDIDRVTHVDRKLTFCILEQWVFLNFRANPLGDL